MSQMKRINFTEDKSASLGDSTNNVNLLASEENLMLVVGGDFGGGTLSIQKYSKDREAFVTVASYTAALTEAESLQIGRGKTRALLAGSTDPNLDVDYWWM